MSLDICVVGVREPVVGRYPCHRKRNRINQLKPNDPIVITDAHIATWKTLIDQKKYFARYNFFIFDTD